MQQEKINMEKFLFKKIAIWVLIVLLILGVSGTVLFGWAVQYKAKGGQRGGVFADLLLDIAEAPRPLILLINDATRAVAPEEFPFSYYSGLKRFDDSFSDDGYLLVSARSRRHDQATIYLYDLKDEKKVFEWIPPIKDILQATTYRGEHNDVARYVAQHPYLLKNGDLLTTSGQGPLVRIDACSRLVWAVNRHFHHSIERAANGNFFVPHVMATPEDFYNDYDPDMKSVTKEGHKIGPLRDDGFAEVSPSGEILREWSIKDILENHGYFSLLYGVGAQRTDRIHLNDAEPILRSDEYVKTGDVMLSARGLSTVFLFRPSTGKIMWLQTGPWIGQHDIDYQGNGIFTVFGNDDVDSLPLHGFSSIYAYDQATNAVSVRLDMSKHEVFAPSGGLHTILENGDIFVEHPYIRLHRLSADGDRRWSFVSSIGEDLVSALHWSRYFPRDAVDLSWMDGVKCN